MKPTLLILAAGMGSRYGGLKQADRVGPDGETIIDYSIYDGIKAGFGKVVLVVRQNILEEMKGLFDSRWGQKIKIEYAIQEVNVPVAGLENLPERKKPWGTAHAVAKNNIQEPFAVINADDFYGSDAFKTLHQFLVTEVSDDTAAMVGYILKNTLSEHGHVSRGVSLPDADGYLKSITERTKIHWYGQEIIFVDEENKEHELDGDNFVSMNFWGFSEAFFKEADEQFRDFVEANKDNQKAEFFIPLVIENLMHSGKVKVKILESNAKWMGVTYREDKPVVLKQIQALVEAGEYPKSLFN